MSIGLSGGFIEPLESTAIHMIDTSLRWLFSNMPDSDFAPALRDRYNKLVGKLYDEVLDFICLHYKLNNREDSQYWIDARNELKIPDSLAENLEVWQHRLPGAYDLEFDSLFPTGTYTAVLLGKQVYQTGWGNKGFADRLPLNAEKWQRYLTHARGKIDQVVQGCADHRTLLRELRGDAEPAAMPWALTGGGFGSPVGAGTVQMPGQGAKVSAALKFPSDSGSDEPNLL